ncbi:MAG: hypothetical protein JHC93_07395 [Parachlamydiales bacterium]|nr:hypothetical protein [Parachlamydiales bacterium]
MYPIDNASKYNAGLANSEKKISLKSKKTYGNYNVSVEVNVDLPNLTTKNTKEKKHDVSCNVSNEANVVFANVLSPKISIQGWHNMILVSKTWKQLFATPEFLKGVLYNYKCLNRRPLDDPKLAYIRDVKTRKNIANCQARLIQPNKKVDIAKPIYEVKRYSSGFAIRSDESLYFLDDSGTCNKMLDLKDMCTILTDNDKLLVLNYQSQILEINTEIDNQKRLKGTTTILYDNKLGGVELNDSRIVKLFNRLGNHFVITTNELNYSFSCLNVVDNFGIAKCASIGFVDNMVIFKNSIVVGLKSQNSTIQFYNNELQCLKTYSADNINHYGAHRLLVDNDRLVSITPTGLIHEWSDDGSYQVLDSSFKWSQPNTAPTFEVFGDSFVVLNNKLLQILSEKGKIYGSNQIILSDVIVHKDQLVIYTTDFIARLDFSPEAVEKSTRFSRFKKSIELIFDRFFRLI